MKRFFSRYTPLQIAMHIYAWTTIAHLIIEFATGTISINPIQEMEQRTGRQAITLLVLLLACSPFNAVFGWVLDKVEINSTAFRENVCCLLVPFAKCVQAGHNVVAGAGNGEYQTEQRL